MSDIPTKTYPPEFLKAIIDEAAAEKTTEAVSAVAGSVPERSHLCPKCEGLTWIDASFEQAGHLYAAVQRCPECVLSGAATLTRRRQRRRRPRTPRGLSRGTR